MATRTVLCDTYAWMTPIEGQPGKYQHNTAAKGDEIDVSDEEAARGDAMVVSSGGVSFSALGSADDLAAVEAAFAPAPVEQESDDEEKPAAKRRR